MLYFSRWKAITVLATALIVCLCAVPNFFSERAFERLPKWAQRHVVLGLDLQGGSHILLQVDAEAVRKEKLEQLRGDVRKVLRENRIGYTGGIPIRGNSLEIRLGEGADPQLALSKLRELSQPLG